MTDMVNKLSQPSSPRRALITGISGQDGSYLCELLLNRGYEVHGIVRRSSTLARTRLEQLELSPPESISRLTLHYGDLTDASSMTRLVLDIEPHEIYNLAAQSHVHVSFENAVYTANVNAIGTLHLLEAVRMLSSRHEVRFYQASTSEMFGGTAGTSPQNEDTPFRPRSPYACSKTFAHQQVVNYREAYDLFAACGILFNHESPRRSPSFVTRKITLAAAEIAAGHRSELTLGNLAARRDWGYAPDYVLAMWKMLQAPVPGDYVIATGTTHSVEDFLTAAFARFELSWHDYVRIDERCRRPTEVTHLCGDSSRARDELGWKHSVTFEELVRVMTNSDRQLVSERARCGVQP